MDDGIRETAYSDVVALIHDFEANSNIYQIANRDHRSAPETCRLGFRTEPGIKHVELGVCSNVSTKT